jgi:uncharacterized membrane protein YdjX (TVP38/TMEM64 family)
LIVTLVRLPPNSPFALGNVAMASVRVPWSAYVVGTLLGVAPRTFAVVCIGAQLRGLDFSSHYLVARILASAALSLLAVVVIGVLADRALRRVTR